MCFTTLRVGNILNYIALTKEDQLNDSMANCIKKFLTQTMTRQFERQNLDCRNYISGLKSGSVYFHLMLFPMVGT
jgi:hypothetical protein